MDSFNNLVLPFDFKELDYQRQPDIQFDTYNQHLLGEIYNDKMDAGQNDLSFLNKFNLKNFAWAFYKLPPGRWVPPHTDHFKNYSSFYKVRDKSKIKRIHLFLEDWKPGHLFVLENELVLNWKAGEYHMWGHEAEHWGGNFGVEDRYTIQLTGTDS